MLTQEVLYVAALAVLQLLAAGVAVVSTIIFTFLLGAWVTKLGGKIALKHKKKEQTGRNIASTAYILLVSSVLLIIAYSV